jgi:hypothetical protein
VSTSPTPLKPLRTCSISEIESSVASAIKSLTNMDVLASIAQLKNEKDKKPAGCKERYTLTITLDVGVANAGSIETNIDALI